MTRAIATMAALLLLACSLAGCERTMKDMYVQPRLGPDAASPLFADGKGSRPPPPGSIPVAVGDLAKTSGGQHGRQELVDRDAADGASALPPLTPALLLRGQGRFDIFCAPCHGPVGDGDGLIARRGFPHPPTFHQARLRDAPDRHFYDVITTGLGVMAPYADRVTPEDRWAIVAYIRALQLSQDVPVAALSPELRARILAMPRPASAPAPEPARPDPDATRQPPAPVSGAPLPGPGPRATNPETS